MNFDPTAVNEGETAEGHLDETPIYELFLQMHKTKETGRLTVHNALGDNHLFLMRGNPVGIHLSEYFRPLGQFLLELGKVNGQTFLQAQHDIVQGMRLPGQVFMEMGVLDEENLKLVLVMQARQKIKQFCNLGSRPFTFGRGLTFLSGFNATPLDMYAVIYLAISQHLGPESLNSWRETYSEKEIRCREGLDPLPTNLDAFEFGAPEERFLLRLKDGWNSVSELLQTGTLPDEEVIVLVRFLQIIDRIEMREKSDAPDEELDAFPQPEMTPDTQAPQEVSEVFTVNPTPQSSPPLPKPATSATQKSAVARSPASSHAKTETPSTPDAALGTDETKERKAVAPSPSAPVQVQSLLSSDPPAIPKRKKKKRRKEPLPSVSDSAVSSVRKENTVVRKAPSIVIETDD